MENRSNPIQYLLWGRILWPQTIIFLLRLRLDIGFTGLLFASTQISKQDPVSPKLDFISLPQILFIFCRVIIVTFVTAGKIASLNLPCTPTNPLPLKNLQSSLGHRRNYNYSRGSKTELRKLNAIRNTKFLKFGFRMVFFCVCSKVWFLNGQYHSKSQPWLS